MSEQQNNVLGWDDEIEKDSEFVLLEEGDYDFEVTNFERGDFPGSTKLDPGPKAVLTLRVYDGEGNSTSLKVDFILNRILEFRISEIHRAVGLKKRGEALKMKWKEMVGLTGTCHVVQEEYTPRNGGDTRTINRVSKFYDKAPVEAKGKATGGKSSLFAAKK